MWHSSEFLYDSLGLPWSKALVTDVNSAVYEFWTDLTLDLPSRFVMSVC